MGNKLSSTEEIWAASQLLLAALRTVEIENSATHKGLMNAAFKHDAMADAKLVIENCNEQEDEQEE